MRKIALGSLSSAELGLRVSGSPAPVTSGVPKPRGAVTGHLESIHHCRIEGVDHTRAIVKIIRTRAQVERREPEYREIGGRSDMEIEVPE